MREYLESLLLMIKEALFRFFLKCTYIKNFKITLAQWVSYNNLLTKNESNVLKKKLLFFNEQTVGQLTIITDCENNNGGNVQSLSGFDLMNPCPQDCP